MKKAYFKYVFSVLLFGTNGIVASRIALPSYDIVLLRTLVGGALLLAIFRATGRRFTLRGNPRELVFAAASGIAMGASWMFLYEAYQQVGVSVATLVYYCGPVLVMALSPLLFRERLTGRKVLGFAAVLCGGALVNGQVLSAGGSGWGIACGVLSAVTYAGMVICNKKAGKITGLENAVLQLLFGFAAVAVWVGFRHGLLFAVDAGDWLPILLLGLVNTGFGCYLYFSSIDALPVQTVAVCGYLEPLSAVFLSVLLLRETLRPAQVLGAALILGGAVFCELSASRRAVAGQEAPEGD